MTNSLSVVAKAFSNTLLFLQQKCEYAKAAHIFAANISIYFAIF